MLPFLSRGKNTLTNTPFCHFGVSLRRFYRPALAGLQNDEMKFDSGKKYKYDEIVTKLLFRFLIGSLLLSISFLSLPTLTFASGFTVRKVGALNVDGLVYSHLWYTNGSVTVTGGSLPNETVTATVDGAASTVTADASGNWSYTTTLATGDHAMSFSSISSTVSFTLTIGALPEGVGGLPTATTPTVGSIGPTVALASVGIGLISIPLFFLRKTRVRGV